MKKLTSFLLAITFTVVAFSQTNFEVLTPKPTPGSAITIEYMPRNTVLQGVKDFEATAYLLEGTLPMAKEITLKQEGGIFKGTVKTNDTTRAVFFSFAKDDKIDNNNDEGYYIPLYNKKGTMVFGANQALAMGFAGYGGIWRLKSNPEKAAEFNKVEFSNPDAKQKLYGEYFSFLGQSKNNEDKELLKAELAKFLEKKDITEVEMTSARTMYDRYVKDKDRSQAVTTMIKERFPDGRWKRTEAQQNLFKVTSPEEKVKLYQAFVSTFGPFAKADEGTLDNMLSSIAAAYSNSGNYSEAKKYLFQIKSNTVKAGALNNLAWKLAGEGINKKPLDAKTGLELSAMSLTALNEEKKSLSGKPPYLTNKQYLRDLNSTYYNDVDTYATLLFHNGEYEKAYTMEKEAMENFKRKNMEMNEAFSLLTEKVKGASVAQSELEKFFEEGKYTKNMRDQLQRLYTADGKTEAQWTSYVTNLEEIAYNKLKAELAKTMINLPAPKFALKDLEGKQVSLASLKGKVVVVDFWATWCGPCIASFPGMQTAVNRYKNNPDVVFLFIDTWENDSNRVQKVTDFIAKNKYNFHVLYDDAKAKEGNDFVVVEDFKVEGIPTKFVIDRNNNIRFRTVGFSGSADATVAELTAMIDMAAAESGEPVKKGF